MYLPHFVYPFIHGWAIGLFPPFSYLWWMMLWKLVCKYLFESLLQIILCIYPDVELLDQMVISCWIFLGASILLSTEAVPFYIPITFPQGLQFLHVHNTPTLAVFCYCFDRERVLTIHNNKLRMVWRLKYKTLHHKTPRREHRQNIFWHKS